jgi:hypothetical protein
MNYFRFWIFLVTVSPKVNLKAGESGRAKFSSILFAQIPQKKTNRKVERYKFALGVTDLKKYLKSKVVHSPENRPKLGRNRYMT